MPLVASLRTFVLHNPSMPCNTVPTERMRSLFITAFNLIAMRAMQGMQFPRLIFIDRLVFAVFAAC